MCPLTVEPHQHLQPENGVTAPFTPEPDPAGSPPLQLRQGRGGRPLPVQLSSVAQSCPTLCNPKNRSTPGLPVHHQLPEFTQIHVHQVGDAIQPSHPLSSPSPPAPNPSQHQSFSNKSTLCMRWPKYWRFSFSISPSKEILGRKVVTPPG